MEKSIRLAGIEQCTGCSACHDICPHSSIEMKCGESIHTYPHINKDSCVSCGLCMRVCPVLNPKSHDVVPQKYYMAWHKDENERKTSTSGGAGAALVSMALSMGWYVCGAAMDDAFELKHIVTCDEQESRKLKGSKYLQSDTRGVFKRVKELATGGSMVLFFGTPCQVEGLKNFLPEKAKCNVVTCGIICHGVNSPRVWKDYKLWLEQSNRSELKEYNFRSKTKGWQNSRGGGNLRVYYRFSDGKVEDEPAWHNLFHWWFGHHYILRPSCLSCSCRKEQRSSDLTIGDFWNIERVNPKVDTFKGVSAIITSSESGESFLHSCTDLVYELVDEKKSKQVLKGFIEKHTLDCRNNEVAKELLFEKEYLAKGFDQMRKDYPAQTVLSHYTWLLKSKLGIK